MPTKCPRYVQTESLWNYLSLTQETVVHLSMLSVCFGGSEKV